MARLFTLGLLIILVIFLIKRKFLHGQPHTSDQKLPPKNNAGEAMVKCAQCEVHLPISEALTVGQTYYCCDAHLPPKQ